MRAPPLQAIEIRMIEGSPAPIPSSRPLTWFRLARLAGVVEALAFALVAALLLDVEAVVVATSLAAGVALMRSRASVLGLTALLGVSSVILFFMSAAALSNLSNGDGFVAVIVPASLVTGAAVTLAAAALELAKGWISIGLRPRSVLRLALVVQALALLVALAVPARRLAGPADLTLVSSGLAFSVTSLRTPSGPITLSMNNEDLFWHTFTVDELGVDLAVPVGAERFVEFEAPPGEYQFYCRIPGHPEAGMVGTLVVGP